MNTQVPALRGVRTAIGWLFLAVFVAMAVLWSAIGVVPSLVEHAPEPKGNSTPSNARGRLHSLSSLREEDSERDTH
jgi:hypothetical protein